ncbi:MAG TPA: two-component regulator propeller domain-containing protein, partial [bacterium]|nr:two-component regulator propeller domain-containing protein [bacterium]
MNKKIFFLTVVMLISSNISALDPSKKLHHYIHRSWQAIDGLPQNSANSIVQTDDGYIWIATQEGLTRFDGVTFTVFSRATHPEILSNDLRSLFKAPDGSLWIGTYSGGAVEFKNNIFTTYNKDNGLTGNLIKTVFVDEKNSVWLGTFKNGINIISDGKISVFDSLSGLPDNSVRAITGKNGDIWAGTLNGLALIRNFKVEKIFREESGLQNINISALFIDSKGVLWVGTKTGHLHFLKEDRFVSFKVPGSIGTDFVNVIFEDSDRNFWIGTEKGLHRFKNGSFETFTVDNGLTYNAVRSIFEDKEKNLWVGTSGGGINIFSDGLIMTYTAADGLSSGDILPVLIDRSGNLWAGTANDGLDVLLKTGGKKHYSTLSGLTDNRVLSLFEHDNGEIWVGTVKGLNVINPLTGRVRQITKERIPVSFSVSNIISRPDGSVWAGTHGDYIFSVSNYELVKMIGKNEGINDGIILTLHTDRSGNVLVGTMNGLYYTDGTSSRVTGTSSGLSSNTVYSLYLDDSGNIWTGTDSGLNIISDGNVYRVRNIEFLYHDSIYSIAPDGNGNIWLGSNKGLFKASLKEVLEKTLQNKGDFNFKRYSYSDGMKSMECNGGFTPSHAEHENKLYFPTLNGISVVDLKIDILNRTAPNVIIEKIVSDDLDTDLSENEKIVFKPGLKKFEIKYTAPSFVNPHAIQFKYRLLGFDTDLV